MSFTFTPNSIPYSFEFFPLFSLKMYVFTTLRGEYNFTLTPPLPPPQAQTHRSSAYIALAHGHLTSLAYGA